MARLDLAPLGALHRFLPVENGSFCRLRHAPFRDGQRRLGAAAGLRACPHALAMADRLRGLDWGAFPHPCPHRRRRRFDWFRLVRGQVASVRDCSTTLAVGVWRLDLRPSRQNSPRSHALTLSRFGFGFQLPGLRLWPRPGDKPRPLAKPPSLLCHGLWRGRARLRRRCGIGWQEPGDEGGPLPAFSRGIPLMEHASLRPGQPSRRVGPPPARGRPRFNCNVIFPPAPSGRARKPRRRPVAPLPQAGRLIHGRLQGRR